MGTDLHRLGRQKCLWCHIKNTELYLFGTKSWQITLCKNIIALSAGTDVGLITDPDHGVMHCISIDYGTKAFKPANILFLYHAIQALSGQSFGLKWRKLKFLTRVMLSCGASLTAKAGSAEIKLPRCYKCVTQPTIGALPSADETIFLYELAIGHNVIDFILYDMENRNFIQVSSSPYSRRQKSC